jgi:PmbA protein
VAKIDPKEDLLKVARTCVKIAQKKGAQEVAAVSSQGREVSVQWRDGKVEKMHEATTRGVSLELYVDGRYGVVRTGDLRPAALESFIAESVEMTRKIAKDPFRSLPDPKLYKGQSKVDLELEDPKYTGLTAEQRRDLCEKTEAAARGVQGSKDIVSVTTGFGDERTIAWRVHSNGFEGGNTSTVFYVQAETSVKDADGRKPEDWSVAVTRFRGDLPPVEEEGRRASLKALEQRGSKKVKSGVMNMVVDNRTAGRLVTALLGPISGQSLQQKRSFLEGKLETRVGSDLFTLTDEPLIPRALGSQHFDGEGIASKQRAIVEKGILKTYLIDTYYGKKLKMEPTTGGISNVILPVGAKSQEELLKDAKDGILVTSFLGGNSNPTTGDFSFGAQGFQIVNGQKAGPVSEMNISGNLLELWKKLVAVGNDPYKFSRVQMPTIMFEGIQFAGV